MDDLIQTAHSKGMTYKDMSDLSGVHQRTIARWAKSQNKPLKESYDAVEKAVLAWLKHNA